MDLIEHFISQYAKEYDYYDNVSRLAAQQLQHRMLKSGIHAIVTSRAKNIDRLKEKLVNRNNKKRYKNFEQIYDDIVDLAGVRVALYFPDQKAEIDKIIRDQFLLLVEPRIFSGSDKEVPNYIRRFSGYWATHYRVSFKSDNVSEEQKHYCNARIEIQVASVLMHAWSEVEHDLVYKPYQGELSMAEYTILDELNGLVLTGELALRRLQDAMEKRINESGKVFSNNFELASYLFEFAKKNSDTKEPMIGDVSILYLLLQKLGLNSPKKIQQFVKSLNYESDKRTVTQQIIDQIIMGNSVRYEAYSEILSNEKHTSFQMTQETAIGFFMGKWIKLEVALRKIVTEKSKKKTIRSINISDLKKLDIFNENDLGEFLFLRQMRNSLVHGIEVPDLELLKSSGNQIDHLLVKLHDKSEKKEV